MTKWWEGEIDRLFDGIGPNEARIKRLARTNDVALTYRDDVTSDAFERHDLPAGREKHHVHLEPEEGSGIPAERFHRIFENNGFRTYAKPDGRTADGLSKSGHYIVVPDIPFRESANVTIHEDQHIRNPVEPETIRELAPFLNESHPEWLVTVGEWANDRPAGYTVQETDIPVIAIPDGASHVYLKNQHDAVDALEDLRDGTPVVEDTEPDFDPLEPDMWAGVADIYFSSVEYTREDETTLRIDMEGVGLNSAQSQYRQARRELGYHADEYDLRVETVETGDPACLKLHSDGGNA